MLVLTGTRRPGKTMNRREFLTSSALKAALVAAQASAAASPPQRAGNTRQLRGGMRIDREKCVGCGNCIAICPMGAIYIDPAAGRGTINQDECVECSNCLRNMGGVCPTGAFVLEDVEWPRAVRRVFSDPVTPHASTGITGRGTEEVKTNDVTGRVSFGESGQAIEFGRPGVGVRFRDIEKVTRALARLRVSFQKENPITYLMADQSTGEFRPELLDEKILSGIVEIKTPVGQVPEVLGLVDRISRELNTVIVVGVSTRCDADGEDKALSPLLEKHGYSYQRAKTNLGLGRVSNAQALKGGRP
jgi:ferredoxin